ncbi:MAG: hypothetical protein AAF493_11120 [Pseudomonadota bacterium]
MNAINRAVDVAKWRLRARHAIDIGLKAAGWSHLFLAPWWYWFSQWPSPSRYLAIIGAITLVGIVVGFVIPVSTRRAIRTLDDGAGLDQRIESALEFADKRDRPIVRALISDTTRALEDLRLRDAIPLEWQSPLRTLGIALLASAVLWWIPHPTQSGNDSQAAGSSATTPPSRITERTTAMRAPAPPETTPSAPRAITPSLEMHTAPPSGSQTAFDELLKRADSRLQLLKSADQLPSLAADDARAARLARQEGASRAAANELALLSTSADTVDERLDDLETLFGAGTPREGESTETDDRFAGVPTEGTPGEQPEGNRAAQENPSDSEGSANVDDDGEGQESSAPQSDRFSTMPEATSGQAMEVPPFPQSGEGEGFEDEADDATKGSGETSGQPGTGETDLITGSPTPRIDNDSPEELNLSGSQQDGRHDAYDTEQRGAISRGLSREQLQTLRVDFTRRAERELSDTWVPVDSRHHIQRYFRALERWQPGGASR